MLNFQYELTTIVNIQNTETYCILWSILASVQPVDDNPHRVTKYEPYRNELHFTNTYFVKGMKIVNFLRFEIFFPRLSMNVFQYSTDKDNDYKLFPLYITKDNKDRRIVDLILYKNQYILPKKLHVFIGEQDRYHGSRNSLNSYTNQLEF